MKTVEITSGHLIDKKPLKALEISKLYFAEYANIFFRAVTNPSPDVTVAAGVLIGRMAAQTTFIMADNSRIKADEFRIRSLPRAIDRVLRANLYDDSNPDDHKLGEVITDGDGITTPFLFKLGTPITMSRTSNGSVENDASITELEFMAKTFGEVERVLGEPIQQLQCITLLRTVAKPVGVNLLSMPTWAVDQITMADGMMIMDKILPSFLE